MLKIDLQKGQYVRVAWLEKKIPPEWLKMRSALPQAFQNFKKRLLVDCYKETN
jgi:hypothetical protein